MTVDPTPDRVRCPGSGQTAHIAPMKPPYRGAGCPSCGKAVYVKVDGTFADHHRPATWTTEDFTVTGFEMDTRS